MAVDDYAVCIVEQQGVAPDCHIQHDAKKITYLYSGDPIELVTLAQQAGSRLAEGRIPVLPKVD